MGTMNQTDSLSYIYSNTAQSYVMVKSDSKIRNLQIINQSGQIVLEQNFGEINVQELASSTYIIHGNTEDGFFRKKLMVK
jgi:hypothetical protein